MNWSEPCMSLIIRLSNEKDLEASKLNWLAELINRVYDEAESGMWHPNAKRINSETLKIMINNKALLIAELQNRIVGCVNINLLDEQTAEFGMLVADLNYRGLGIGRELVKAAENLAMENGCTTMRLELLVPKTWKHPSKEFLKNWYTRIGYNLQYIEPFEKMHADKVDQLATECDFCVYHKHLEK